MKKTNLVLILSLVLVIGFGVFRNIIFSQRIHPTDALEIATLLETPKSLKAFSLIEDDKPFTNSQLKNQWSLVFFGFAQCPDVCPKTLGVLSKIQTMTKEAAQIYFVSINPTADTPSKLKKFLNNINPSIHGITGEVKEINDFSEDLYAYFSTEGTITHSGALMLINPKGEIHAIFTQADNPAIIAKDLLKIQKDYDNGKV